MRTLTLSTLTVAAALALASCASGSSSGDSLTITDPWVRTAEEGMTAAFGVVENTSSDDLTIVSAATDAAGMVELHEVSEVAGEMSMRQIDGGFPIPAGESVTLQPGGWHIMLMNIPKPILAGDQVEITLTLDTGDEVTFTATAKDFTGADEGYDDSEDMADMDMGDE